MKLPFENQDLHSYVYTDKKIPKQNLGRIWYGII